MSNLSQDDAFNEVMTKEFLYRESNIKIKYEFGLNYSKEEFKKMNEVQLEAQTIAQAINGAAQFGWQIASTNTVLLKMVVIDSTIYICQNKSATYNFTI